MWGTGEWRGAAAHAHEGCRYFDEAGRIMVGNRLLGVDSCKYGMLGLNPRNSNLKMQISRNAS